MIIQAHHTESKAASLDLDIYTGEYTVKVNKGGKFKKTKHATHDEALKAYMEALK